MEVPRKVPYELHPLTLAQTLILLDTVRGHRNEALFVLAVATGMRRGKLAGLKWQDVDLQKGELHVYLAYREAVRHGLGQEVADFVSPKGLG